MAKEEGEKALRGYERYAIYYAPVPDDPLAVFGAGWLGRGMDAEEHPMMAVEGWSDRAALIGDARRYGLHGTLKAPFALANGVSIGDLDEALASFAAARPSVRWSGWRLSGAFGFTSLQPAGPAPGLEALAAGVVTHFAPFGAKLDQEDLARRRRFGLSLRQEAYLAAYGYPYVLEDFSFHVTLSGALSRQEGEALRRALETPLAAVLKLREVHMSDLCLFGDPGDKRPFRLLRRYALGRVR